MKTNLVKNIIAALFVSLLFFAAYNWLKNFFPSKDEKENSYKREINLSGEWKFQIGDDSAYSSIQFDDNSWDKLYAPSAWEEKGYHGYDGVAWYRKKFSFTPDASKNYLINLGYIDDADETYLNGKLLAKSGSFPPQYSTAHKAERKYPAPLSFFTNGENTIAIRVFDAQLSGGIPTGEIALNAAKHGLAIDQLLDGVWKFTTGDNPKWSHENFNDENWESINVPSFWESQGFDGYDHFAWYRTKFLLNSSLYDEKLVLLLGKIDDLDEVFINGVLIGSTGGMKKNEKGYLSTDKEYLKLRKYYIPSNLLYKDKENVIAVRVYDGWIDGGIYEGPIGLMRQTRLDKQSNGKNK